jgi:serine/threonine-protein kinase
MTDTTSPSRIREAFDRIADAPAAERTALLRELAADDPAVASRVAQLLETDADEFLSAPPAALGPLATPRSALRGGTRIGGYELLDLIGEGGMGEVYAARLVTADFEKRVAIKVLRADLVTPEWSERFARERRILARLTHRNIAALHDGGLTPDGRPYLVMELVSGTTITRWCRDRRLGLDARLNLFAQVAGAVHHAHQMLVVHRDLKPGNILVGEDGTAKLLDFGIAKVLATDPDEETTRTSTAITPAYAAPEQLTNEPITTATDVYALGLLLCELLTGERPLHRSGMSVAELVQSVTTDEAPLASGLVRDDIGIDRSRMRSALRGDLDAIIAKAIARRPSDRYASAAELLSDLGRFRQGLAVEAVRGRTLYRARKAIRRHRTAFLALSAVVLALGVGAVTTRIQALRATREQQRAEQINAFLTTMLRAANPFGGDRDITVAATLDRAARTIDLDPPSDPAVEASLREAIGNTYASLGRFDAAERHLRRAVAIRTETPDAALPLAGALHALGSWHDGQSQYQVADSLFRRAIAVLGSLRSRGADSRRADLMHNRARMLSQLGEADAGDSLILAAIALQREVHGPASAEVGVSLSARGLLQMQHGEPARAESTLRQALDILRASYTGDRPETAHTLSRLATALELQGNRTGADSAYRTALRMFGVVLGADHPEVTWTHYNLAGFLLDGGDWHGALSAADEVLARRGITVPESQAPVSGALQIRGLALAALGDPEGAERALRESLTLRRQHAPAGHWIIGSAESVLGEHLVKQGRTTEGRQLLQSGSATVTAALGADHPQARRAAARLADATP